MPSYPLMVEDLTPNKAVALVCTYCGWETEANEEQCGTPDVEDPCARCGRALLDWKYMAAERCQNCGKLDWHMALGHKWCSRRCKLQGEYALTIAMPSQGRPK